MLIIRRKEGESIIINGNIEVKILSKIEAHNNVSLGIAAPRNISVHRKEIQEKINESEK